MTRLYIPHPLHQNVPVSLTQEQHHYIRTVLRFQEGDKIQCFNAAGEWTAIITLLAKSKGEITPQQQIRAADPQTDLHLIFAPIKHDATHFIIEKATELGVTHLHPVLTAFTNTQRLNADKIQRNTIEATQQCERLSPPLLSPLTPLRDLIATWPASIPIVCCRERGERPSLTPLLKTLSSPLAFLIGPEGGFSDEEFAWLERFAFVHFASLGSTILRAETAAITALSGYHATLGNFSC